jgi:hypothetical protein
MMRRNSGFRTPVRCFVAVRPGDRFTITGLAGTFLRIGLASLLVRAVQALGLMLLFLVLVTVVYFVR